MEIPSGMQMMLKTLGIDPQKIMADFKVGLERFEKMAQDTCAQLDRVEKQNAEILAILKPKENSDVGPDKPTA